MKHHKLNRFAPTLVLVAFWPSFCVAAQAYQLTCPSQILESELNIKRSTTEWHQFIAAPLYLHSVAIIDGPPERLGQIKGVEINHGPDAWTDHYDLGGSYAQGKWLQCAYGSLNEIVLSKRIDDRISACTVEGRKGPKAGQNTFAVRCH